MSSSTEQRAIGVFANYQATEQALRELQDIGYDMGLVSVIGQDSEHLNRSAQTGDVQVQDLQATDHHADDGAQTGLLAGGTLGGLTGLLVGLGTLAIPGVGPIMLAGAAATAIATTLAGSAIGATTGGLLGGLVGLGFPEDRAQAYSDQVTDGKYLVIVDGTEPEIARAEPVLKRHWLKEWDVYPLTTRPIPIGNRANDTTRLNPTDPATSGRF